MRPDSSTPIHTTRSSTGRRNAHAHRRLTRASTIGATVLCGALVGAFLPGVASAATQVDLGTAAPFAVVAGSEVTDVPTSAITGNVGLSPATGADITGLTKAEVTGTINATDGAGPAGSLNDPGLLTQVKNDLTTAYVTTANDLPTTTYSTGDNQLGGKTLVPGVYAFGHGATANLTAASPLVLSGNGVFVFQASSDLVTASGSAVELDQRRPGVQRLLGGRQLGHPGVVEHVRRHADGPRFGDTGLDCDRPGPHPGPQCRGHPGRQHHHRPGHVYATHRARHHSHHDTGHHGDDHGDRRDHRDHHARRRRLDVGVHR